MYSNIFKYWKARKIFIYVSKITACLAKILYYSYLTLASKYPRFLIEMSKAELRKLLNEQLFHPIDNVIFNISSPNLFTLNGCDKFIDNVTIYFWANFNYEYLAEQIDKSHLMHYQRTYSIILWSLLELNSIHLHNYNAHNSQLKISHKVKVHQSKFLPLLNQNQIFKALLIGFSKDKKRNLVNGQKR